MVAQSRNILSTQAGGTPALPQSRTGLFSMLSLFISRGAEAPQRAENGPRIHVWDDRLNGYRSVNLADRDDPLWPAAEVLARVRAGVARPAA